MGKKRWILTSVILILSMGIFFGCSSYSVPKQEAEKGTDSKGREETSEENGEDEEEGDEDIFARAEEESQEGGFFSHGVKNPNLGKDGNMRPFVYKDGEFRLEYTCEAEGKGRSVGFLLFVNGKATPYRVNDGKEKEYCHIFPIDKEKLKIDFTMGFTPTEGKKGDKLQIVVDGIYHAGYVPDMKETSGWGFFHNDLAEEYQLAMKADAPGDALPPISEHAVKNVKMKKQKADRKFLKEELPEQGYPEVSTEMLEQSTYYSTTFDGKQNYDNLDVSGRKKVHVVHKICGPSDYSYRTTIFMNHQPASKTVSFKLSKGDMAVVEADIDTEAMKENSVFYIVTVPEITSKYLGIKGIEDVDLSVHKASSILLYRKEEKISEVFYGNDGNLLLHAGREIHLYDVGARAVRARMRIPNLHDFTVQRLDAGYAIVGAVGGAEKDNGGMSVQTDDAHQKWRVYFLDSSLERIGEVDLFKLLHGKGGILACEDIAISHSGKKIAVNGERAILLCDVQSGKCRKLLDSGKGVVANHLVFGRMNQIYFTENDEKIAFFAEAFREPVSDGEKAVSAWGTISLDGKVGSVAADSSYHAEEMFVYRNHFVLPESMENFSSRLLKVDLASGKKSFVSFSDKREGRDGVYLSAEGKYFATACLSDNHVTVRVYDMEEGKILMKKVIEDQRDEYFYRIPGIYLMDDGKKCVVVLGMGIEDIETKVEQFGFTV